MRAGAYLRPVPEISRFFGIVISMYYDDHLPPHFHAHHAGQEAAVTIASVDVIAGNLSPRALGLVREWASAHRGELMGDWELARAWRPLVPIEPLG